MRAIRRWFLLAAPLAVAWAPPLAHAQAPAAQPAIPFAYPTAQLRPVAEQYGHTTLIDNYRWMESPGDAEAARFLHDQTAIAAAALARISGHDRMRQELAVLQANGVSVTDATPNGDTVYYLRRGAADDVAKLVMRQLAGGAEHVLVDPEALPGVRPHSEIVHYEPSQDGTHVVFALAPPGADPDGTPSVADASDLRVLDTGLGTVLADRLAGARFGSVAWRRDSKGFYYTRADAAAQPGAAAHMSIYLHMLGTDSATDVLVLGSGHLPFPFAGAHAIPRLIIPPSSDYAVAIVSDGVTPDLAVYAAPLAQLDDQPAPWQNLADQRDGVIAVAPSFSIAFLLTHDKAPRLRVVSEDLAEPGFASARTVVAESGGVITDIAAASDALFVARRDGADTQLLRLDYNDSVPQDVRLPFQGSIGTAAAGSPGGMMADARSPGVVFNLQGWTQRPGWMRYDPRLHRVGNMGLGTAPAATGTATYDTVETSVAAADGTKIPLSIIMRHGTALDHARPTLLETYGSYGFSFDARYMPAALAWADQGGVYAIAHVRGGGEYGEAWHAAGRFAAKSTSVGDFLSCATALEKLGYTDAAHMTAAGTTAGAVVVMNAAIRSPAAFRAVAVHDGLFNPLRAGTYVGGASAVREFGAARDPAQFPALLAADAFSQVKDGVEYPAVLLNVGGAGNDVPSWQSMKMAARLQTATTSGRPVLLNQTGNAEADRLTFLLWQVDAPGFALGAAPAPVAHHGRTKRHAGR